MVRLFFFFIRWPSTAASADQRIEAEWPLDSRSDHKAKGYTSKFIWEGVKKQIKQHLSTHTSRVDSANIVKTTLLLCFNSKLLNGTKNFFHIFVSFLKYIKFFTFAGNLLKYFNLFK